MTFSLRLRGGKRDGWGRKAEWGEGRGGREGKGGEGRGGEGKREKGVEGEEGDTHSATGSISSMAIASLSVILDGLMNRYWVARMMVQYHWTLD